MIEFAVFLRLLRNGIVALLVAAFLGVGATVLLVKAYDAEPHKEVTVSLVFKEISPNENVAYDGYYIIESERRFGDILGQILARADLKDRINDESGVVLGRVSRVSPLDYKVAFAMDDEGAAEEIFLNILQDTVSGSLEDAVTRSGEPIVVGVSLGNVVILPATWTLPKALVAGSLLGFFFGVIFLLLRHSALPTASIVREVIEVEID